jgi:hypothetical protein
MIAKKEEADRKDADRKARVRIPPSIDHNMSYHNISLYISLPMLSYDPKPSKGTKCKTPHGRKRQLSLFLPVDGTDLISLFCALL